MKISKNRVSTCFLVKFNTLNLVISSFKLERERERETYIASLARQDNHYLFNSKELAFLDFLDLRKNNSDFSGFFSTNFCRLFNIPYLFSFCSAKFSTLFSNHSARFLISSANNIPIAGLPGTHYPIISFFKVSDLKFLFPLVKVGQDITIQIDSSMYVFANFGVKVSGEFRLF